MILILGYFGIDPNNLLGESATPVATEPAPIVEERENNSFETEPIDDGSIVDDTEGTASGTSEGATSETTPREVAVGGDWYEIYFTDPTCPSKEDRAGGIDMFLAEDIVNAAFQVDIVAFDLDSEPIIEALISAEKSGTIVRVVVDDEHTPVEGINRLRGNGISVIEDKRTTLMHDKFVIIDQEILWTGSTNFSSNGIFCNNNNLVRMTSPDLAANYGIEMDEMYEEKQFGARSPENTLESLEINGIKVENYFSPETKVAPVVASAIANAESEILFLAFSFTHEDVGEAVLERAGAGVDVRGVFETVGSETSFSYYPDYRRANLDNLQVRQDGNKRIMHHKVFVIDRETVIFGSFNFTKSGNDRNDENTLIVHDPEFASYFVDEFEFIWAEAKQE
ncbi:MAG: phospholipase D-like domain-containing protein [Candidatus Promineifilaceae bacterium]